MPGIEKGGILGCAMLSGAAKMLRQDNQNTYFPDRHDHLTVVSCLNIIALEVSMAFCPHGWSAMRPTGTAENILSCGIIYTPAFRLCQIYPNGDDGR